MAENVEQKSNKIGLRAKKYGIMNVVAGAIFILLAPAILSSIGGGGGMLFFLGIIFLIIGIVVLTTDYVVFTDKYIGVKPAPARGVVYVDFDKIESVEIVKKKIIFNYINEDNKNKKLALFTNMFYSEDGDEILNLVEKYLSSKITKA